MLESEIGWNRLTARLAEPGGSAAQGQGRNTHDLLFTLPYVAVEAVRLCEPGIPEEVEIHTKYQCDGYESWDHPRTCSVEAASISSHQRKCLRRRRHIACDVKDDDERAEENC